LLIFEVTEGAEFIVFPIKKPKSTIVNPQSMGAGPPERQIV
jgi:hypothetical protein